jgi:hypothetical protein
VSTTDAPADSPTTPNEQAILYCPSCGYDLRASTDGRCNECGLVVDRASLRVSAFPWAHRRTMGRVRAYLKTVWQVLADARSLAYETAKPQAAEDARSFAWVTGALLSVALLVPVVMGVLDEKGLGFLAVPPNSPGFTNPWLTGWKLDVILPWSAGATLWPVPFLCIALFAFYLARAARPMFASSATRSVPADRASAIALYTAGPLALLLLANVTLFGSAITISLLRDRPMIGQEVLILLLLSALIAFVAIVGTLGRAGQWLARVRHGGFVAGVSGAAWLFALWLWGAAIFGVVLPWCIGFLWLVIDSLR